MTTLGLDLGSRTGWALAEDGKILLSGFVDLVPGNSSGARSQSIKKLAKAGGYSLRDYDPRPHHLFAAIREFKVSTVAFEDVQFVQSLAQGQLWASLRGAMWLALPDAKFRAIGVGELKKFATGRGDAQKEQMIQALELVHRVKTEDDNEADACWLAIWGSQQK